MIKIATMVVAFVISLINWCFPTLSNGSPTNDVNTGHIIAAIFMAVVFLLIGTLDQKR